MSPARFRCATLLIFQLRIGQFLGKRCAILLYKLSTKRILFDRTGPELVLSIRSKFGLFIKVPLIYFLLRLYQYIRPAFAEYSHR